MKVTIEDGKGNVILAAELPATAHDEAKPQARSAVVDGHAPLLGGPVELEKRVAAMLVEARSLEQYAGNSHEISQAYWQGINNIEIELLKLVRMPAAEEERGPASNASHEP